MAKNQLRFISLFAAIIIWGLRTDVPMGKMFSHFRSAGFIALGTDIIVIFLYWLVAYLILNAFLGEN